MASEKWKVWSNEKKEFLEAADMVCRLLTVDELVALAPETILMNSEQLGHCWFEAPGAVGAKRNTASGDNECFKKTEEMKNGRPVYNAWNEKYNRRVCFKNSKHSCFVSNLSSKWSPLSLNMCLILYLKRLNPVRWTNRYLYYHSEKKYWTLGIDSTDEGQNEKYLRSAPTDCYSPLVAPWLDSKFTRYRAVVPHELDVNGYPEPEGGKKTKYRKVGCWN